MMGPSPRQLKRFASQLEILRLYHKSTDEFTILDCGTEFGHTGRTVKEAFPRASVTGIEIHLPMLDRCRRTHGRYYDELIHGDALTLLHDLQTSYSVVIAAELIEHLPKEEGLILLDLLKVKAGLAIVTSPVGFKEQRAIYENPHEVHVSGWDPAEFVLDGWTIHLLDQTGYTLGVYYRKN